MPSSAMSSKQKQWTCECTACKVPLAVRDATAFSHGIVLCTDCRASGGGPPQDEEEATGVTPRVWPAEHP